MDEIEDAELVPQIDDANAVRRLGRNRPPRIANNDEGAAGGLNDFARNAVMADFDDQVAPLPELLFKLGEVVTSAISGGDRSQDTVSVVGESHAYFPEELAEVVREVVPVREEDDALAEVGRGYVVRHDGTDMLAHRRQPFRGEAYESAARGLAADACGIRKFAYGRKRVARAPLAGGDFAA